MANDIEWIEHLMKEHQNMVYTLALAIVGDPQTALDLAQETFLQAYKNRVALQLHPQPKAWLRIVVRNLAINYLNRYRNKWKFFSELENPNTAQSDYTAILEDHNLCPRSLELSPQSNETTLALKKALLQLPDAQRVAIALHYIEGLSYEEIAKVLKITVAKVKTDIHRGKLKLRRLLNTEL